MRQFVAKLLPEELQGGYAGRLLGADEFDLLIDEDAEVRTPDGRLMAAFYKGAIDPALAAEANRKLKGWHYHPKNRGTAVIGRGAPRAQRDTYLSKTNQILDNDPVLKGIDSGIFGYYERVVRTPYCRPCAPNSLTPGRWPALVALAQGVDRAWACSAVAIGRYTAQLDEILKMKPCWRIPGTIFTTITVNRNWQTRVHKDAGDFEDGFGTLTVCRKGVYSGGYFVMPTLRPRIAFDMYTSDVLLSDVHEWHGNTPIEGIPGQYERMSFVFYMRRNMVGCLSPQEELLQAQRRKPGQRLF